MMILIKEISHVPVLLLLALTRVSSRPGCQEMRYAGPVPYVVFACAPHLPLTPQILPQRSVRHCAYAVSWYCS